MMTELTLAKQPHVEQGAVFRPDATPVPTPKPPLTTEDIIIPSENSYTVPIDTSVETKGTTYASAEDLDKQHEKRVETQLLSLVREYQAWLDTKVRNEIATHIIAPAKGMEGAVNIAKVAAVIQKEMETVRDTNFRDAQYLENTAIPQALVRKETVHGKPSTYTIKDEELLWTRVEAHQQFSALVASEMPDTEDGYWEIAETYIARLFDEARQTALDILKEQKQLLEIRKSDAGKQIASLESTIETLSGELAEARHEVEGRDMQLLDSELDAHVAKVADLTQRAKDLAA